MGSNTHQLIRRRILAFLIDYLVILGYGLVLLGAALWYINLTHGALSASGPVRGQLVGFATLTLPVFLYFYLMERSRYGATLGKRRMGLRLKTDQVSGIPAGGKIFTRNLLKFLPWEVAHTGVHWIINYNRMEQYPPVWVFVVLILPQLLVMIYGISLVVSRGERTLYDRLAGTRVVQER